MTRPLTDPDCANAITVEPWFSGDEHNIRVMVACQLDLGGCGWSCSFAGSPDLRCIPWSRVVAEVEKHQTIPEAGQAGRATKTEGTLTVSDRWSDGYKAGLVYSIEELNRSYNALSRWCHPFRRYAYGRAWKSLRQQYANRYEKETRDAV